MNTTFGVWRSGDGRVQASGGALTPEEARRYSRHLLIPEFGRVGQERLKSSRVLIVGTGGLGSPVALYLAAAGVGHIGLVDFDFVDTSNLQRQVLFGTSDVGDRKVNVAARRVMEANPHTVVEAHDIRLTSENALEILKDYDVIADGTDNFQTRYLVNDACVLLGIPNVYASIYRFDGQISVFATSDGPCYRCVYPDPPPAGLVPSCAEAGVLGVLPGMIGTLQAAEVIKLLTGLGRSLAGRMLLVDALEPEFRTIRVDRDPMCPACGQRTIRDLVDYEEFCGLKTATAGGDLVPQIAPADLALRLERGDEIQLIDVREPNERDIANISGSVLIPLGQVAAAAATLDRTAEIVVHCKSGARSAKAAKLLIAAGFAHVWNLDGGILRWSRNVDPNVPLY